MGGQPRITVVVPTWDRYTTAFLDDALASIRAQSITARILVIDNASDPAARASSDVDVIRIGGRVSLGSARRCGVESVSTRYVMLWDADDIMVAGTLERLVRRLDEHPEVVVCATRLIDGSSGRVIHWPRMWTANLSRHPAAFAMLNAVSSLYPVAGAAIRTSAAQASCWRDVEAADDWAMGVSLAFRGQVDIDRRPGRIYRRHGGSLSAEWQTRDALQHAGAIRHRLRHDSRMSRTARPLMPMIWLAQHIVILGLRPLSRRMPGRRSIAI